MNKRILFIAAGLIAVSASVVVVSQNFKQLKALLTGYEEVPSVSTVASGEFRARISNDNSAIEYELSYTDLEGDVTQAHIHFGQVGVNGAIEVWLCANNPPITNAPAGTQACPAPPATITGTIVAADVTGQPTPTPPGVNFGQGIQPGEFEELLRAIRAGRTYVNVHTTKFPGGEVRSQIDPGKGQHH